MGDSTEQNRDDWRELVRQAVLDEASFIRAVFTRKVSSDSIPWLKIVIRPVLIKNQRHLQFSYFDTRKDVTKNYALDEFAGKLEEVFQIPFEHAHVQSSAGDLHIRITRKGKALVSKGKPSRTSDAPMEHNRPKHYLLSADKPDAFLQAMGIMDQAGRILPTMQAKYHQINEFLRIIEQVVPQDRDKQLHILDCGSGSAWLTFAAYHFLRHVKGLSIEMMGIDSNQDLIAKSLQLRDQLEWEGLEFGISAIRDYAADKQPDMVMSLHACDTATDEAIALGIRHGSAVILAAPCCQHELHHQLDVPLFQPVLRHGILRERLADLLTDTLRALVLRIMGYQTRVIEFIAAAHTPKNLMIRAEKTASPGDPVFVKEYLALKEYWQITPAIEGLIGEPLERIIQAPD